MLVRQEELLVLKGGGAHEVRKLGMIILAEGCVYSAFATNRTTVFLLFLHVDCRIGSSDEDVGVQGWLLTADFKLQLPYQASRQFRLRHGKGPLPK